MRCVQCNEFTNFRNSSAISRWATTLLARALFCCPRKMVIDTRAPHHRIWRATCSNSLQPASYNVSLLLKSHAWAMKLETWRRFSQNAQGHAIIKNLPQRECQVQKTRHPFEGLLQKGRQLNSALNSVCIVHHVRVPDDVSHLEMIPWFCARYRRHLF